MTRIKEHKNYIRRISTTRSVITDHRLNDNYEFDWDNVEISEQRTLFIKKADF